MIGLLYAPTWRDVYAWARSAHPTMRQQMSCDADAFSQALYGAALPN